MKLIPLQHTDLRVSQLCLGTNQFGTGLDDTRAAAILDQFAALGGNFLDTARSYGDWIPDAPRGASEQALGRLLAQRDRSQWVLATKGCEFDYRAGDFSLRVNPNCLRQDVAASLAALQTDYIDLYWLHRDDPSQPVATLIDALIAEQQAGRIRYFGCSNWSVERIREAQAYAGSIGHSGFVACQPMWGLAEPDREAMQRFSPGGYYEDGYQRLHAEGLTMLPYSSQSRGFFTKLAEQGDAGMPEDLAALYLNDANRRRLPVLQRIAAQRGASINQVVLAYLVSQPWPTVPIVGASRPEQLLDSNAACDLALGQDEISALRDA
ncbi:MAG TPA: aldo/keto reductase [Spongiibacteraceae bacterium]|nr:aldo/keto reductase [Spongiibacteraceae bacterium]HUH38729.1 aldo/keto reductase [Spongiibacteraceae bacterium]